MRRLAAYVAVGLALCAFVAFLVYMVAFARAGLLLEMRGPQ